MDEVNWLVGAVSSQDYQLLERMNLASADKYKDLADHAENLLVARQTMLNKCADGARATLSLTGALR